MEPYTIGITTFDLRLDQLKNLIESIRLHTNTSIIVTVNGNINSPCNEQYRQDVLRLFTSFNNIYPVFFTELRGLAKMWNTIFIHSNTENVLVLNDDIVITDKVFFEDLEYAFNHLQNICKLQNTWYASFSHFIAKKKFIRDINFFDERLLGFGEEDGDITHRYIQLFNKEVPALGGRGLSHTSCDIRQNIKSGIGKYSLYNREFIYKEKYKMGVGTVQGMFDGPCTQIIEDKNLYPYEEYFEENKYKLI